MMERGEEQERVSSLCVCTQPLAYQVSLSKYERLM